MTHPLQRAYRITRLALLLLSGVLVSLMTLRWSGARTQRALRQSWSAAFLDALGIQLETNLEHLQPGSLLVANHISWLDILVINAVLPSAFVSKAEVRQWPVIGWLAARHETVFLRRGSRGHAKIINEEIARILDSGQWVVVFPEGTTTDGTRVLPFHAALIQPALSAGHPVIPLALSYWTPEGQRSLAPRYDGDISLGDSFQTLLRTRRLTARITSTPVLGTEGEDRKAIALAARQAILGAAELPHQS